MLTVFIATFVIFALVILGMSLGYLVKRKSIQPPVSHQRPFAQVHLRRAVVGTRRKVHDFLLRLFRFDVGKFTRVFIVMWENYWIIRKCIIIPRK